jgi:hypothetical protein
MSDEERAHTRYAISLAGELVSAAGLQRCEVQDLSAGGCRLGLVFPIAAGAPVRIRVTSPLVSFDLAGPARVAWATKAPPYQAGLAFEQDMPEKAGRFLHALLGPVRLANKGGGG